VSAIPHPSTHSNDLDKQTLTTAMRQEYQRLIGLFDSVVEALEADDPEGARCAFRAFEASLLKQLAFDGGLVAASTTARERASAVLAEHASLRRELLHLRIRLDLGMLRAEATRRFVGDLRGHVARKCSWLYACVESSPDESLPHSEKSTVPDGLRVRHSSEKTALPTSAFVC
jgi:hypothetical protein